MRVKFLLLMLLMGCAFVANAQWFLGANWGTNHWSYRGRFTEYDISDKEYVWNITLDYFPANGKIQISYMAWMAAPHGAIRDDLTLPHTIDRYRFDHTVPFNSSFYVGIVGDRNKWKFSGGLVAGYWYRKLSFHLDDPNVPSYEDPVLYSEFHCPAIGPRITIEYGNKLRIGAQLEHASLFQEYYRRGIHADRHLNFTIGLKYQVIKGKSKEVAIE